MRDDVSRMRESPWRLRLLAQSAHRALSTHTRSPPVLAPPASWSGWRDFKADRWKQNDRLRQQGRSCGKKAKPQRRELGERLGMPRGHMQNTKKVRTRRQTSDPRHEHSSGADGLGEPLQSGDDGEIVLVEACREVCPGHSCGSTSFSTHSTA